MVSFSFKELCDSKIADTSGQIRYYINLGRRHKLIKKITTTSKPAMHKLTIPEKDLKKLFRLMLFIGKKIEERK